LPSKRGFAIEFLVDPGSRDILADAFLMSPLFKMSWVRGSLCIFSASFLAYFDEFNSWEIEVFGL